MRATLVDYSTGLKFFVKQAYCHRIMDFIRLTSTLFVGLKRANEDIVVIGNYIYGAHYWCKDYGLDGPIL
jgi:hypothetical protein